MPDRIDRHAFQSHTSVPLWTKLTAAATGEVAYREEVRKVEYSAVSELRWKIAPRADVLARYEYDTGGAGPNTNSSVKLGSFGLRCAW